MWQTLLTAVARLSRGEMLSAFKHHGIGASRLNDPEVVKWKYAYVLENARRLEVPVPVANEVRSGYVCDARRCSC